MQTIAIIGAGIAGATLAARLSRRAHVILIEAESAAGYHASGRSAAMIIPSYGPPEVAQLTRLGLEELRATPDLLSPRALMLLGQPHEGAAFAREAEALGLEAVSFESARRRVPLLRKDACAHLALREDCHDLDTDLLLQNALRTARAGGTFTLHLNTQLRHLSHNGTSWLLHCNQNAPLHADCVVNAAGAWASQVGTLAGAHDFQITPLRRSMIRLPLPEGLDPRQWPMLDTVGEQWYAKPDAGALLVSPGDEDPHPPHDAWADDLVLAEGLARMQTMLNLPLRRPLGSWAGLRSFAPDRVPVVGFDPVLPGFFWLAAQGGYGFQTAPALSTHAANLLLGHPSHLSPSLTAALAPDRFTP